jgi:LPS-assembly protein
VWILHRLLNKPRLVLALLGVAMCMTAMGEGLALKKDLELKGSANAGKEGAMFVTADKIESTEENVVEATGKVEARQSGQNFFADWLRYDMTLNEVRARGDVRFEQPALTVTGDTLHLKLDDSSGELIKPVYQLVASPGRGDAARVDFINKNQYTFKDATYTTCPVGDDDWYLDVGTLSIDKTRDIGVARDATLRFLGVPILYTPWMSFPLNNARETGILAPTLGTTQRTGIDIVAPYYFNLAPNYDATLYPRIMSKRGFQLGAEFRYLFENFSGTSRAEYLPNDSAAGYSRWGVFLKHLQNINPNLTVGLDFNRVSDNDYFRDLSNLVKATSQSYLNREAWVTYQREWWNADLRVQSFQTLQDPAAPLAIPYNRLPQLRVNAARDLPGGVQFNLVSEATHFAHPTQTEGTRVLAYPTVKLPLTNSYGFITPQLGWHLTHYNLDNSAPEPKINRNVPIASLDAGVILDRPFSFKGQAYQQTLEPRFYYVYAPFREQNSIPIFDTALLDFNYAQMFTENQFVGGDRVNDANQFTLAVTSRFFEEESGIERLRVTLGQRYYFSSQKVTLPGVSARDRSSTDLLAALSGQITRAWRIDTGNGTTVRQNLGASYRPSPGRILNFSYRTIDKTTEQIDVSGQWPLSSRWYGVFRYNYSLRDNKLVEGLAGLEYNAGCWAIRGVVQQLATKQNQSTSALFFQLELSGMGHLGSNPLDVLKNSVPGYRPSNEFTQTP